MLQKFLFTIFCFATTVVHAEEAGKVNAQMDGVDKEWFTIAVKRGEETVMTGSFRNSNRLTSMTVQGHPEPRFTTRDVISINADWFGPYEAGKAPMSVEIIFMPNGMSNPFYTSDQVTDVPALTIDASNLDSDPGHITGSFSGKVCLVAKLYEAPDLDDCKELTGTFDTRVMLR